ncbi:hypothetical protein GYMLUDRAFT_50391 [Collybiopsis luxurians FD-317 M1]|uniref:Uncharacterized protein n=1 Tax=Collybiopsis luxurians FD-317 M1 TaxID=944289 RepID=A0A0D0C1L4_9AGAR|nr:hypothetical protein GYMLUDRAFT_50391 [Collybiopsis luxurians FD-317 M1]
MAFQTSTSHTSDASSSTSTSTDSNDNNNTDNGSGQFFTPTSSPPLILAFLAIGLLATAIIAALGWRRVYFARYSLTAATNFRGGRDGIGAGAGGRRGRGYNGDNDSTVLIGEKPKLWDLWTDLGEGRAEGEDGPSEPRVSIVSGIDHERWRREVAWESVMPIAVTPLMNEKLHHGESVQLSTTGMTTVVAENNPEDHHQRPASPPSTSSASASPNQTRIPTRTLLTNWLIKFFHPQRNQSSNSTAPPITNSNTNNPNVSTETNTNNGISTITPPRTALDSSFSASSATEEKPKGPLSASHLNRADFLNGQMYESVQVTMAIAMPRPRPKPRRFETLWEGEDRNMRRGKFADDRDGVENNDGDSDDVDVDGYRPGHDGPEMDDEQYEYTIGVCRVPWPSNEESG